MEFSLIIPLFLLLLMSVFDFGRAVFAYTSITNAAREGTRLAIVNQTAASIVTRAQEQSAIAEIASPSVTVQFRDTAPNPDYLTNPICAPVTLDCVAVVTFQTTYRPITPVIAGILFPSGVTLTARSIQQVEFVCPNSATSTCPKQP